MNRYIYIDKLPKLRMVLLVGIVLFLFTTILMLGLFINKPDTIEGSFKLVAMNQPVEVFASHTGKIVFMANSNDTIEENQEIAFISNTTDLHIANLLLAKLDTLDIESLSQILNDEQLMRNTGVLYPSIATLKTLINKYIEFNNSNIFRQNVRIIELEVNNLLEQIRLKSASLMFDKQSLRHIKSQLLEDSLLYAKGVIVITDLEKRNRDFVNQNMRVLNEESTLYQLQYEKNNKDLKKDLLISEYDYNNSLLIHDVNKAILALHNDILLWKKEYVIVAPVTGALELNSLFEDKNIIKQGSSFARILPLQNDVIAHLVFPSNKSNKLCRGMSVRLFLDSYPSLQNGYLYGNLFDISPSVYLTQDDRSFHTAKVKIDALTQPFFEGDFKLVHNMTGKASIVIEEKSLFEQLLYFIKLNT